jgi:hypothetical protein
VPQLPLQYRAYETDYWWELGLWRAFPLIKIAARNLPFSNLIVLTATSEALNSLAEALRSKESRAIEKFFQHYEPRVELISAANAQAAVDGRQPRPFKVSLPDGCLYQLSDCIQRLATLDDYSEVSLSKLNILNAGTSQNDVILRKVNQITELQREYDPDTELDRGATWEGVLYHQPLSPDEYSLAWQAIEIWSSTGNVPASETTEVWFADHDAEEMAPAKAFETLLTDSQALKVVSFFSSPFMAEYGEPRTDVQVWFEKETTEVIVTGRAAFTGDFQADMQNYVLFLQILREVAALLKVKTFAWGAFADQIPAEQATPIEQLWQPKVLCGLFDAMRQNKLPTKLAGKLLSLVQSAAGPAK